MADVARSALRDVGTRFFKRPRPGRIVGNSLQLYRDHDDIFGPRRNLNMLVIIIHQQPINEIC
jgi:hypothetical protein